MIYISNKVSVGLNHERFTLSTQQNKILAVRLDALTLICLPYTPAISNEEKKNILLIERNSLTH